MADAVGEEAGHVDVGGFVFDGENEMDARMGR